MNYLELMLETGQKVVVPITTPEEGDKVIEFTLESGQKVAIPLYPHTTGSVGVDIMTESGRIFMPLGATYDASVDPVQSLTMILDPADSSKILLSWVPGANNDHVRYDYTNIKMPSVVGDGELHGSPDIATTHVHLSVLDYFTTHYAAAWGMKTGLYSATAATASLFVTIPTALARNAFKCYVTMPENLLQDGGFENGPGSESGWGCNCLGEPYSLAAVMGGDAARSGSYGGYVRGYSFHTDFIPASFHQKNTVNLTGAKSVVFWFRTVATNNQTAIPYVVISQGTTTHSYSPVFTGQTGVWQKVVWDVSALDLTGLWNFSIGIPGGGYGDTKSNPLYFDDVSVIGTAAIGSWYLYGDDDAPPNELYGSGVTVVTSGATHVTGYDATIWYHDGQEYSARIAYRLSDANHGVYEIDAAVTVENSWPKQLYFGNTFLCSNIESDAAELTYHGFLPWSVVS